jgi:hypothetical protein
MKMELRHAFMLGVGVAAGYAFFNFAFRLMTKRSPNDG